MPTLATDILVNVTLLVSTALAVALGLGLVGIDPVSAVTFGLVAGAAAVLVS